VNLAVAQDFNGVRCHPRKGEVSEELGGAGRNDFVKRTFKDHSADVLRPWIKAPEFRAFGKIADAKPTPSARNNGV
jgi:hypothetical protein